MYFRNTGFGLDRPSAPFVRGETVIPPSAPAPTLPSNTTTISDMLIRADASTSSTRPEPITETRSADTARDPVAQIDPSERPPTNSTGRTAAEQKAIEERAAIAARMQEQPYEPNTDDLDDPKEPPKEPEVDSGTSTMTILMVAAVGALFLGPLLLGKKK